MKKIFNINLGKFNMGLWYKERVMFIVLFLVVVVFYNLFFGVLENFLVICVIIDMVG